RARESVLAVARSRPLVLGIGDGELTADGAMVVGWSPAEMPFAALRSSGIGALVLGPGLDASGLDTLLARLGAVDDCSDPEQGTAALRRSPIPGVQFRAAASPSAATTARHDDWVMLPAVATPPLHVQALVARDLATNLPAAATQVVLADLGQDAAATVRALGSLLAEMLARGDTASAAWLLEETSRLDLTEADRQGLQRCAEAACDDAWFTDRLDLGSRDEVFAACSLALQLGADATARFARLVQHSGHALAPMLLPLLPTR
ncbi:MAG: hypothetical protein JNK15_20530, partial [Planctomycetes bacterium]|nr:hypothetical protein [Planctomycetota bacterium]